MQCKGLEKSSSNPAYHEYLNCRRFSEEFVEQSNNPKSQCTQLVFQLAQTRCSTTYEQFLNCTAKNEGMHGRCRIEMMELSICLQNAMHPFSLPLFIGYQEEDWLDNKKPRNALQEYPDVEKLSGILMKHQENPQNKVWKSTEEMLDDMIVFLDTEGLEEQEAEEMARDPSKALKVFESFLSFTSKNLKDSAKKE